MTNLIITEYNCETNEVIQRPMLSEEIEAYEKSQLENDELAAKLQALELKKATAKAKLVALGLDLDDLKALNL